MATWVTHLMIADRVLEKVPGLDRHFFCVGNIAPDCNVENEDWTVFTPSREVTHWMSAERKTAADSRRFYEKCISSRRGEITSRAELSFLLGYYAHLIADAEFQQYIRDPERVSAAWQRVKSHPTLSEAAKGMPETWDSVKKLIGKSDRLKDIHTIEAEYLAGHPGSGYLMEIMGLRAFPDFLPYLPKGAIPRKIGVMGYLPTKEAGAFPFVAMSRREYAAFLDTAVGLVSAAVSQQ